MVKTQEVADGTIDYIKSMPDPLNKIKLYHFNGKAQVDHRHFTLEKAKQYNPDWYINGDGDEIFHEKEIDDLIYILKLRTLFSKSNPQIILERFRILRRMEDAKIL